MSSWSTCRKVNSTIPGSSTNRQFRNGSEWWSGLSSLWVPKKQRDITFSSAANWLWKFWNASAPWALWTWKASSGRMLANQRAGVTAPCACFLRYSKVQSTDVVNFLWQLFVAESPLPWHLEECWRQDAKGLWIHQHLKDLFKTSTTLSWRLIKPPSLSTSMGSKRTCWSVKFWQYDQSGRLVVPGACLKKNCKTSRTTFVLNQLNLIHVPYFKSLCDKYVYVETYPEHKDVPIA